MNKKDLKRLAKYNADHGTAFETKAQMRAHEKAGAPQRKAAADRAAEQADQAAKALRASQLEQVRAEFAPTAGTITKYKEGRAHCHGCPHSRSLGSIELPFKKAVKESFFVETKKQTFFNVIGLSLQGVIALDNSQGNRYIKALESLRIEGATHTYIDVNSVYFTINRYDSQFDLIDSHTFCQAKGDKFEPFSKSELWAKPSQSVDQATSQLIDTYAEHTINHFERNN